MMELPPQESGKLPIPRWSKQWPIANHQEGRGSTGTNKMFSQKMQQDVWPETVLKMNR